MDLRILHCMPPLTTPVSSCKPEQARPWDFQWEVLRVCTRKLRPFSSKQQPLPTPLRWRWCVHILLTHTSSIWRARCIVFHHRQGDYQEQGFSAFLALPHICFWERGMGNSRDNGFLVMRKPSVSWAKSAAHDGPLLSAQSSPCSPTQFYTSSTWISCA